MFREKTVFILGAGASWHYGYPTGEALVKKIIEKANYALQYFKFGATAGNLLRPNFLDAAKPGASIPKQWEAALLQSQLIASGLTQVNPLVIDYFLGWNPQLQAIGRLLIAWVILECEHNQLKNNGNINRGELLASSPYEQDRLRVRGLEPKNFKDDWCRFVIHQLAIQCERSADILKNDVRFVTFNYDISLERALYGGLRHIEMFESEHVEEFLSGGRIMHVYGKVRENPFERPTELRWSEQGRDPATMRESERPQHLVDYKMFLDELYTASKGIYVIDPTDKRTDKTIIDESIHAIGSAKHLYVLGYGFDENNSARLELPKLLNHMRAIGKFVFYTNLGDINRVTRRASKIFFGIPNKFASGVLVEQASGNHYERSVRNVYEALELDFDQFV